MNNKILLLEDDRLLAQTLQELLEMEGYDVTLTYSGDEAIDATFEHSYDLYIFDINVPQISGIELLRSLRYADDTTPTIFISALVDLNSISEAFGVGGDDYLKKPFFPEELLLHVKAKLSKNSSKIKYKNIEYDPKTKTFKKDKHIIALGEVQEKLLNLFLTNTSQVMDKEILLECLEKPSPTALRVAITKLKQTTGLDIRNLRGIGYTLE